MGTLWLAVTRANIAILRASLAILETEAVTRPNPTGTRMTEFVVCNPYWMQHLVRPYVFEQLGNGNKVGSPVSTSGRLTKAGCRDLPKGPYYSVVTLGGWVT
jgi:hypothetical protein